jgi:uncharacterized protein
MQKLYGYKYNDREPGRVHELLAIKQQIQRQEGDNYPEWVLDKLNIQYMLANRVAMGRGLNPHRFLWVPFDDALMLPLDNTAVADNPDRKFFYQRESELLKKYMSEAGVTALPGTLDQYVTKVLTPTLERQRRAGAVAVKFEAAYLRSLDFGESRTADATPVYERYAKGGVPSKAENLEVQNALFRAIAREAGRLGMPVHIHTGTGCGGYFDLLGSNPGLLNSILSDESLRQTTFVLIHGGSGPYTKVASFLLGKPNVYADFSEQDALISTRAMAAVLRNWLEAYPEKVMFGTDLAPRLTGNWMGRDRLQQCEDRARGPRAGIDGNGRRWRNQQRPGHRDCTHGDAENSTKAIWAEGLAQNSPPRLGSWCKPMFTASL